MTERQALRSFARDWSAYLEQRGHCIRPAAGSAAALLSRNGQNRRYRWLLVHSDRATRMLTRRECLRLRREIRLAGHAGEHAFAVVCFEPPVSRLIVLPAADALAAGEVSSGRGGIAWEPQEEA